MTALLEYHAATNHSPASVRSNRHALDWSNQPLPFKIYTSLEPLPLPFTFEASRVSAFSAIAAGVPVSAGPLDQAAVARLCYFANGVTRVVRRPGGNMPFRAAACTGALYHIELYVVCADLDGLPAGVYHYGAHDNGMRLLRQGDYRAVLAAATGGEPSIANAPVVIALTSTFWRNAWKYQSRAYRHVFWDAGTVLANLLSVAAAHAIPAHLIEGFADSQVNALTDVDPSEEATICLVALGAGAPPAPPAPEVRPLGLPTAPLSKTRVDYPLISSAHAASSLASGADAAAWRAHAQEAGLPTAPHTNTNEGGDSIESVILRRGSSRRFSREAIPRADFERMLRIATTPIASDVEPTGKLTQPYLIVNAVDGLGSGAYVFNRATGELDLLTSGDFRREAAFLDLDQDLAGDAAVNVYWLADLHAALAALDNRGYRAAQLEAAIEGGRLYLGAYATALGATGLTFFDDEVTRFFSPHATKKSVMFLVAIGHPRRRPSGST